MSPHSILPKFSILSSAVLCIVGCSPANNSTDGGPADGGQPDAFTAPVDSGFDAGPVDSGPADSGIPSDAGETDSGPAPIEVLGAWVDAYASDGLEDDEHATVSDQLWQEDSVVSYDNATRSVITWTYASDAYSPNTYNKIMWTKPSAGTWFWCEVDYGEMTEAAAVATTKTADSSNPSTCGCPATPADGGGCGGFSWTQMNALPSLAIDGKWTDSASAEELTVSDVSFGAHPIVWYGAEPQLLSADGGSGTIGGVTTGGWIVTKDVPGSSASNAGTYNLVVWLPPVSGVVSYCVVASGVGTAELAQGTAATANAASPSTAGCNGGSWPTLTPAH